MVLTTATFVAEAKTQKSFTVSPGAGVRQCGPPGALPRVRARTERGMVPGTDR